MGDRLPGICRPLLFLEELLEGRRADTVGPTALIDGAALGGVVDRGGNAVRGGPWPLPRGGAFLIDPPPSSRSSSCDGDPAGLTREPVTGAGLELLAARVRGALVAGVVDVDRD